MANESVVVEEIPSHPQLKPNPKLRKAITIVIVGYGVFQVFVAMVPQGFAAYVQFYDFVSDKFYAVPLSVAVGISAHLGKFALITYFNKDALKNIANLINDNLLAAHDHVELWKFICSIKGIYNRSSLIKIANLAVGIIPGLVFGLLAKIILKEFSKLVEKTHPGEFFDVLAKVLNNPFMVYYFVMSSFFSNLIGSQGMIPYAIQILKELANEWANVNRRSVAGLSLGTLLGLLAIFITTWGFYNFFALSEGIGEECLEAIQSILPTLPPFIKDLITKIFAGCQLGYMANLGYISTFPLMRNIGKTAVDVVIDTVTRKIEKPSASAVVKHGAATLLSGLICLLGGLPNVFQAMYEDDGDVNAFAAEAASALTEAFGTYILMMMLMNLLGQMMLLLRNAPSKVSTITNSISQTLFGRSSRAIDVETQPQPTSGLIDRAIRKYGAL